MLKDELISNIAKKTGQTKAATDATLRALSEVLKENITTPGTKIKVHGVATFEGKDQAARVARNPKTGGTVNVPAKFVIKAKSDV